MFNWSSMVEFRSEPPIVSDDPSLLTNTEIADIGASIEVRIMKTRIKLNTLTLLFTDDAVNFLAPLFYSSKSNPPNSTSCLFQAD